MAGKYSPTLPIIIIINIIIIISRYECLLSQAFSSRYFSGTSGDPHRSGFKLHTAVISVLCVILLLLLLLLLLFLLVVVGNVVAQWLRRCATNRQVAGSIPDGVIGIFH